MSEKPLGNGKLPPGLLGELLSSHRIDDPTVLVGPGIGFDAAALDPQEELVIAKSDPITFVEDRAADYVVDVNANDVACLGGTPRWLLVTALLPSGRTTPESVRRQFEDLHRACRRLGVSLVGGHTEITTAVARPILIGHLLGTASPTRLVRPGQARPGDRLLLARPIAVEGTALLALELRHQLTHLLPLDVLERAAGLLIDPGISVVKDARLLVDASVVSALHDPTEGGLATGIRELAMAAAAGAVVSRDNIAVLPETRAIAGALGIDPLGLLASGSLLAAVPAEKTAVAEQVCREGGMPYAWIGKVTPAERGFVLRSGNVEAELPVFAVDESARIIQELHG
jgi:hydrogenase maturation factor